jgi:prephenate dehydrogenase
MRRWNTVAIIGVGLLGGSIGLALRSRRLADQVVGIGRRASRLRWARLRGAVTSTTTQLAQGVAAADLVVVCTPVEQIVEFVMLASAACSPGTLITDVGSTKEQIVTSLDRRLADGARNRVAFVGSHPMAGSERSGVEHARADLFEGRVVIVTPSYRTRPEACRTIGRFWKSLGAKVLYMTPSSHDRSVGAVSHLPHLVASALATATSPRDLPLAAGGWQDTTRIAAGDAELWRQILLDNRLHVLKSVDKFAKVLSSLREALERNDKARLAQLLAIGKRRRDSVGS